MNKIFETCFYWGAAILTFGATVIVRVIITRAIVVANEGKKVNK